MKEAYFLLVLLVLAAVSISGCPQEGAPTPETPPVANETPPTTQPAGPEEAEEELEEPKKEIILPLKFTYTMPIYMKEEKEETEEWINKYFIYYVEKEITCNGRDALAGVLSSYDEGEESKHSTWTKFTLYLDNGEFGSSKNIQKSELAFDDVKSQISKYDTISQMNVIFASAGENFVSSDVWTGDIPTILKDVYCSTPATGNIIGDFSVMKGGVSSAYSEPCTEFTVNVKGDSGFRGEIVFCVADADSRIALPYLVSMRIPNMDKSGMDNEVRFELQSVEEESSGIAFYPQCMEPIYCETPETLSEAETNACRLQGKMVQEVIDENGCITKYECLTLREFVKEQIKEMQPATCPEPSDAILDEALICAKGNHEPRSVEMDDAGCWTSLDC